MSQTPSWAQAESLCDNRGYVVGFFNGVWNMPTQDSAYAGLEALRWLIGDTFNNEPVEYELFYNHTGSTVDVTFLQDIAETFMQHAKETDASGALAERFEYLWEVLSDGEQPFWARLLEAIPASGDALETLLEALYEDFTSRVVAGYALLLSNSPTASDAVEHAARLDELALQGQKILLVAHSQGNLFVNAAYDYIVPKVDANSVMVVHIAPASPTLQGDYVLANIDGVINALRDQELDSVPDSNVTFPSIGFENYARCVAEFFGGSEAPVDCSGHKLIDTYLDGTRPGRNAVADLLNSALSSLVTPVADAHIGFFTVTLTWDGSGDVDLHTFEPNGAHVFYSARTGSSGFLDVVEVIADGPEHYFATCSSNQLQVGTYQIGINNFAEATGRVATVQVASERTGVLLTRTLDVGPQRGSSGDGSPIPVFQVTVSQDEQGQFTVNAQ